ncbi:hypothetical protein BGZ63DRAFT_405584 [Mariannaea sp. PMI_226]|nr:hypothetical protein BGZ63DRAFT_405584 [Mariannaea sp. PMI_226]
MTIKRFRVLPSTHSRGCGGEFCRFASPCSYCHSEDSSTGEDSGDTSNSSCDGNTPGMSLQEDECGKTELPQFETTEIGPWSWLESVQDVVPLESRLPPCKQKKTPSWHSSLITTEEPTTRSDPKQGFMSPTQETFRLACPFYLFDTTKYRSCLLKYDLQSNEDIIHHLQHHHLKPPYCPMCYGTFQTADVRDGHVRARMCELRKPVSINGIDDYQRENLAKLTKRDGWCLGDREQWLLIWHIVFPNIRAPSSPYLTKAAERDASIVRTIGLGPLGIA